MNAKVSIAMATYDGANYLKEQLESFTSQSRLPDELVVCDDGSQDDTLGTLHQFASTAPFPVRIHSNPVNIGLGQNFGRAISLCSGDFIFLSDQDDVWLPAKLETVSKVLSSPERPYAVINDAELMKASGETLGLTVAGQARSAGLSTDAMVMGCSTALRRDFAGVVLPIPPRHGHDDWIHVLARSLGKRKILPDMLQQYRRHDANASNTLTSSTRPVSWRHRYVNAYKRSNFGEKLQQNIDELDTLLHRLVDREGVLLNDLGYPEQKLRDVIAHLRRQWNLELRRVDARQIAGPRRLVEVARLRQVGGYDYREGWARMLMDCLLR